MEKNIVYEAKLYMEQLTKDAAHDREHIYRVVNMALDIAKTEMLIDMEILLTACILHDIGREKQFENPKLCHAREGAKMAYKFLREKGVSPEEAIKVKACIETHRFRSERQPESIEAKILFDADTLDVTGALGIARSLLYEGRMGIPLYHVDSRGSIIDGKDDYQDSFLKEYDYKLFNVYNRLYTKRGKEIAQERKKLTTAFYEELYREISFGRGNMEAMLEIDK
ncbi:MAG TPA: HD domain-containing protein [Lachnospiraceae bacterium]|nr:HD domain-containing protein [Lachnospiraceae bacterium]